MRNDLNLWSFDLVFFRNITKWSNLSRWWWKFWCNPCWSSKRSNYHRSEVKNLFDLSLHTNDSFVRSFVFFFVNLMCQFFRVKRIGPKEALERNWTEGTDWGDAESLMSVKNTSEKQKPYEDDDRAANYIQNIQDDCWQSNSFLLTHQITFFFFFFAFIVKPLKNIFTFNTSINKRIFSFFILFI